QVEARRRGAESLLERVRVGSRGAALCGAPCGRRPAGPRAKEARPKTKSRWNLSHNRVPGEAPVTDAIKTNPAPNPFANLSALRWDQSYADTAGVKKLLATGRVRKPNRQDFVRVHPDPTYRLTPAAIIEVKEDREVYLVTPDMAQALPGEFATVTLFTTINRQGTLHLWPVKLPNPQGRHIEWHRSAAEEAERAQKKWVRVTASMTIGANEIIEARGDFPDPLWPDFPFQEILRTAFRDRIVDRADHPLVQRLQGIM